MKKAVVNNTNMPIYVGASMIPPGETREFEEADIPAHLRPKDNKPAAQPAAAADPVAKLQAETVKEIKAALPNLDDASLARLKDIEEASETPRASLLEMIGQEQLFRAGEKQ